MSCLYIIGKACSVGKIDFSCYTIGEKRVSHYVSSPIYIMGETLIYSTLFVLPRVHYLRVCNRQYLPLDGVCHFLHHKSSRLVYVQPFASYLSHARVGRLCKFEFRLLPLVNIAIITIIALRSTKTQVT